MIKTTIDAQEIAKFSQHATKWWDPHGPLKTLHAINPCRIQFIQNQTVLSGARVLDIGCGGGILSEAMAKAGAMVVGLDVEPQAIEQAALHAAQEGVCVEYICSPIEQYENDAFDVITCMEMLEHVTCPNLVIEHAARLLKPGGILFLSTINRTLKAYMTVVLAAEYLLNLLPRQTHDFEKFIKPSELAHMCRTFDLDVVSMAGIAYDPLHNTARLNTSIDVNYLLACRKP